MHNDYCLGIIGWPGLVSGVTLGLLLGGVALVSLGTG